MSQVSQLARDVLDMCRQKGLTIGTVESCTGGLVAAALTEIAGSSAVVMAGLVTYSNAAKSALADVPSQLIEQHGAVSEQVAKAMATGGRHRLNVDICVAITGVAGPGGGSPEKPVGLVCFAISDARGTHSVRHKFGDLSRSAIRQLAVQHALDLLHKAAISAPHG